MKVLFFCNRYEENVQLKTVANRLANIIAEAEICYDIQITDEIEKDEMENDEMEDDFTGSRMVVATVGEVIDIGCRVENTRYVGEIEWVIDGDVIENAEDPVTSVKKNPGSNSLFTLEQRFDMPARKEWEGRSLVCRYSQKDHNDKVIHTDTIEAMIVYVKAKSQSQTDSWLIWITIGCAAFSLVVVYAGGYRVWLWSMQGPSVFAQEY